MPKYIIFKYFVWSVSTHTKIFVNNILFWHSPLYLSYSAMSINKPSHKKTPSKILSKNAKRTLWAPEKYWKRKAQGILSSHKFPAGQMNSSSCFPSNLPIVVSVTMLHNNRRARCLHYTASIEHTIFYSYNMSKLFEPKILQRIVHVVQRI